MQSRYQPVQHAGLRLAAVLWALGFFHMAPVMTVSAQDGTYAIHPLETVVWHDAPCEAFGKGISEVVGNVRMVAGYARRDDAGLLPVVWMVDGAGASSANVLAFPSHLFAGAAAVAINSQGQIVGGGILDPTTGAAVGLYWADVLAAPIAFPALAGEIIGQVQQVGDSGVVVGISKSGSGSKAVAWRIKADNSIVGPLVLPTRSRGASGDDAALGIRSVSSSSVEIVGRSAGAPVVWKVNVTSTGLTMNGGAEVLDSTGEASDVNGTGSICGMARDRGVVWGPLAGKKRTKSQLSFDSTVFGNAGKVYAINDLGMVIGDANLKVAYPARRAVLWMSLMAPMRTLESLTNGNHPFVHLESANAINNSGDIAGYGWQGPEAGFQAYVAIPNN